ncbi:MAG: TonB-dependent receptor [Sphingomonadaceae bacterium]
MPFRSLLLLSSVSLLVPSMAAAAEASDDQPIIVTGLSDGYRALETTSGTKTKTPLLDVPQSISVVTEAQLNDQAIRSVADLVRLFPGISAGQGEGNRDQVTLRGNNSTADFFVDGLRDDVQYFRSFYNIERVEAHKGPNATIFGRGGGGGIINRVTKTAQLDSISAGSAASVDSFGAWYVSGDINAGSARAALRINAFYEALNNHRNVYDGERYAVNPVVGVAVGDHTKLQLGYEYVRDSRVADRGVPSAFAGTIATPAGPVAGFTRAFFGVAGLNVSEFEGHVVTARSETNLSDALTLSTQALYGDYDKLYRNAFPATPVLGSIAAPTLGIEAYRDTTTRETFIGQGNLTWKVRAGGIDHLFLVGGEYTSQDSDNERANGFFSATSFGAANRRATVAFGDPIAIPPIIFVRGAGGDANRAVTADLKQVSAYIQDQISFGPSVDLIAGLRYDRFDLSVTNRFTNSVAQRSDDLWAPRVGLVIKPVPQASVYISYTKSFLPQSGDQFLTLDASRAALEPETFDNYEVGAKWNINPDLTATLAVFRLDRSNTRAAGPVPGTTVLTGAQRSSGLELGLSGRLMRQWQTSLGYALTNAAITGTTIAGPAGRRVAQVPRHQVSLWNRYDVTTWLGVGVGVYHQSKSFTSISNTTVIPAYTRVDAALFFTFAKGIEGQINIENITDQTYFPTAHNDVNITPGAPLNARFTLTTRF